MTKQKLNQLFIDNGLTEIWNDIEPLLTNSINISLTSTNDDEIEIGQSKMGGLPDLPKSMDWFEYNGMPMSFLAQINLAEVTAYDTENKLPKSGILYFFYDVIEQSWGYDPNDKGSAKVYYYKGDIAELERKNLPDGLDEDAYFNSCAMEFESVINFPDYESDLIDSVKISDQYYDALIDLRTSIYGDDDCINKLLGHSDNVQGGMELECELVTNGINVGGSEGYANPKRKELEGNIGLWHLLFQIDSNDECDMMWGDCGRLYFWIRENDLKAENFENSWLVLQCG